MAVALLVLIALALRMPNLGESLWYDEVINSTHYQIRSWHGLWRFILEKNPAPLYPLLTFVWVAVVGDHELLVRLPSLVFGLGSIVLTYHIARSVGSNSLAFLAGLFLCLSPAHVWFSQEATAYAMAMCLLLAAVYTWSRLKTTPFDARWYATYLVLLLASVFTHYFVIVFLGPLSLAVPTRLRWRLFLAHAVVALCFVVAMGIKYLGGNSEHPGSFLRPFTIFEWWMLFFNWFLHGNSLWTFSPYRATTNDLLGHPLLLLTQILCALVLARGLWPSHEKRGGLLEQSALALLLCALPMALLLLTAAGYHKLYIERYVIVALPFFAIALARGVARFSTARVRTLLACTLIAIGVGSYAMLLVKSTRWTVYKQNPDFRSAARVVRANSPARGEMAVTPLPLELSYYLDKEMPGAPPGERRPFSPADVEDVLAATSIRTVVLANVHAQPDFGKLLDRFTQDRRLHLTTSQSFKDVDVYVFRRD
ncbi:MAG: glycosyltransferase family 39 protein [Vicinamibacterales bacterium]